MRHIFEKKRDTTYLYLEISTMPYMTHDVEPFTNRTNRCGSRGSGGSLGFILCTQHDAASVQKWALEMTIINRLLCKTLLIHDNKQTNDVNERCERAYLIADTKQNTFLYSLLREKTKNKKQRYPRVVGCTTVVQTVGVVQTNTFCTRH